MESISLEVTPVYHGVSILVLVCVFKSFWIITFQLYYLFDVSFFFFLKLSFVQTGTCIFIRFGLGPSWTIKIEVLLVEGIRNPILECRILGKRIRFIKLLWKAIKDFRKRWRQILPVIIRDLAPCIAKQTMRWIKTTLPRIGQLWTKIYHQTCVFDVWDGGRLKWWMCGPGAFDEFTLTPKRRRFWETH